MYRQLENKQQNGRCKPRHIDNHIKWKWPRHYNKKLRLLDWIKSKIQLYTIYKKLILFIYLFFLPFNIVLVFPYINMNPSQVYMCSQSWTPLPPPSPYRPSGSSQCTSPKHPISCIEPGLAIRFLYDIIHVSVPFSQIIPPSP